MKAGNSEPVGVAIDVASARDPLAEHDWQHRPAIAAAAWPLASVGLPNGTPDLDRNIDSIGAVGSDSHTPFEGIVEMAVDQMGGFTLPTGSLRSCVNNSSGTFFDRPQRSGPTYKVVEENQEGTRSRCLSISSRKKSKTSDKKSVALAPFTSAKMAPFPSAVTQSPLSIPTPFRCT